MVSATPEAEALRLRLQSPPKDTPFSLPIAGSEKEGRTPVYRHWNYKDGPLLKSVDPTILTAHDMFEAAVRKNSNERCLGYRPWDLVTKTYGKYKWITYAETAVRRKNFGAGIVEVHKNANLTGDKYGVGIWCQNRPEWQITGMLR